MQNKKKKNQTPDTDPGKCLKRFASLVSWTKSCFIRTHSADMEFVLKIAKHKSMYYVQHDAY